MNFFRFALVVGCWLPLHAIAHAGEPTTQEAEFFEKKIRPVLVEHCWNCHSERAPKLKGELRLDSRAALLTGGERGPALIPGHPEKSRLIEAIGYKNVDLQMPPKTKLTDAVIADLTAWVKMGAPWPGKADAKVTAKAAFDLAKRKAEHWAWQPIRDNYPPLLKDDAWPLATSDRYILGKLEAKGIAPAPPAEPRVLLRRLYFDLIGLPPTPEDLAQFEKEYAAKPRAAIEQVVDRLLASPQFGERWARHWLDLVRYAESRGHEFEPDIPNAWQYRDYVIRAFNADVPYNQFVTEHVAGDLLPQPRLNAQAGFNESILGTGFWFLGEEVHSPVDIRADEADRFDNRIDVLTKTFLGLTVSCARCHDHKFDAISTKDYYALYGFLRSSAYRQVRFDTLEHNKKIMKEIAALREKHRPTILKAYAETFKAGVAKVPELIKQARAAMLSGKPSDDKLVRLWTEYLKKAAKDPDDPLHAWATLPVNLKPGDAWKHFETYQNLIWETSTWRGWVFSGDDLRDDFDFPLPTYQRQIWYGNTPARPILGFQERGFVALESALNNLKSAPGTQTDHGALGGSFRAGKTLYSQSRIIDKGRFHYYVKGHGRIYAAVDGHTVIAGPLHGALVLNFDTKGKFQWVSQDLTPYVGHRAHWEFSAIDDNDFSIGPVVESDTSPTRSPRLWVPMRERPKGDDANADNYAQDTGMGYVLSRFERGDHLDVHGNVPKFATWMFDHPDLLGVTNWDKVSEAAKPFFDEQARLTASIRRESRLAPAMIDIDPVNEHVFIRGSHKDLGAEVPRRFLEALAGDKSIDSIGSSGLKQTGWEKNSGSGRLKLARQMTDPKINPFITRVIVNRVWHHLFGRGIVASTDNFGMLGERPTHPELLDSLAVQFARDGWSIKKLIRQLVLSRAYQMSSHPDEKADAADPENLLLHRMRLRRLEGEAIRDSLLVDSGRLNAAMYGQSTPIHLTPFLDGRGRPASGPLDGDGRRSIYLSVRRNFLSPFMMAFDTPSPFSTVGRRTVSNVPAQALILMNDPFVHQMADLWGKKIATSSGDAKDRIARMYQQAFTRPPTAKELADCQAFLEATGKPLTDPKPWSDLAHVLINVKEFIYVE